MKCKEHLTNEGLQKIVSIKYVLNQGLSNYLNSAFPLIVPAIRPQVKSNKIMDPNWIYGFASGEGCFHLGTKNTSKGGSVGFRLLVTQHIRDAELLKFLVNYLECGKYYPRLRSPMYADYLVTRLEVFKYKIIPFFDKYSIHGVNSCDFNDFKKVFLIRENRNALLTADDRAEIKKIKLGMNKGRMEGSLSSASGINKKLLRKNSCFSPKVSILPMVPTKNYSTATSILKPQKDLHNTNQIKFIQWLAGLIDGDGHFHISKKGFSSLKIIMDIMDKSPL